MRRIVELEERRTVAAGTSELDPFEAFFHAENDGLFRLLYVLTGSRQEAEDLAQESFVRVLERWDRVGAMEDPTGYLYRTAVNAFRNRYRRSLVAVRRTLGFAPPPDATDAVEARHVV